MVTVHEPRPILAAIKSRVETQTSKNVGKGKSPGGSTPYAVVFPLPDSATFGSITDNWQVARQLFQITFVGADMDEAQWLQEKTRTALLGWQPSVSGWDIGPVEMDSPNLSGGTDFDGPVFTIADRFSIYVSQGVEESSSSSS
jgi:hypothetical protein